MPHRIKGIRRDKYARPKASATSLETFIDRRDYTGALTFLDFSSLNEVETLLWKGYCAFHSNNFETAQEIYIDLLSGDYNYDIPDEITLYLACVYYFLQMYPEASEAALDGPECALKHRIMYHVSQKLGDSAETILSYRQKLRESEEDQLSRAAMLYAQCNYQEACEIYKRLLTEDRNRLAMNLYISMCYFKLVRLKK
jgi:intraflagellar transport protein 56